MQMSEALQRAIQQVSQEIVSDMEPGDRSDAAIVAEVTLDASRLAISGHVEANIEMKDLVQKHGWDAVKKEAEKHVTLY